MAVYMIADIKITDDKWVPAYAASVHELVHKHGGKYLSRSGNVETLEGTPQISSHWFSFRRPKPSKTSSAILNTRHLPRLVRMAVKVAFS